MKSFLQHIDDKKDRKKLDENPDINSTKPIDEATAGDLLIGLGAAGGLLALKKGWDAWGKGSKLHKKLVALNPLATKKQKADVAKAAEDKRKDKVDNAKTIADDPDASDKDKEEAEKDLEKHQTPDEKETRRTELIDKAKKAGDQETLDKLRTDDEKATAKVAAKTDDTTKKQTAADAELLDAPRDSAGNLENQPDAQKSKKITGKAPPGWATSPEKSPGKGEVWTTKDQEKWDADAPKRAEKKGKRAGYKKQATKTGQDVTQKSLKDLNPAELKKRKELAKKKKAERDAKEKAAKDKAAKAAQAAKDDDVGARLGFNKDKHGIKKGDVETGSYIHTTGTELVEELLVEELTTIRSEFQRFVIDELLIDLTEKSRTELLEELVLEETMTLQESNELQAIMALDDVGIEAEINKKGQVVVKKKDLKKAEKALKKSFRKGGQPKLVGEEVELNEASSKKARNKAADEIEAIADKGGAEAPTLFSLASKLRKGTHSTTGLKLSKQVTSILKANGIKEEVRKQRTAYEVVSEARERLTENVDEHAANELYLYIQNERDLQKQKDSIIKNVVKKIKSEKYDHRQAPKLWSYLVDSGAKHYIKEFGGNMKVIFPKEVRQSVAVQFANEYKTEIDLGNYN